MNNNKKPTNEVPLDDYESQLEKHLDSGNYQSHPELEQVKSMFTQAANNHQALQGSKHITLRVNKLDLLKVKAKAKQTGIPYQQLVQRLIHQYATDQTTITLWIHTSHHNQKPSPTANTSTHIQLHQKLSHNILSDNLGRVSIMKLY